MYDHDDVTKKSIFGGIFITNNTEIVIDEEFSDYLGSEE